MGLELLGTTFPMKNTPTSFLFLTAPPLPLAHSPLSCFLGHRVVTWLESAMVCKPEDRLQALASMKVTSHDNIAPGIVFG